MSMMSMGMNAERDAAATAHARAYGERLLGEVKEENLAELLRTLHALHAPSPADPQYSPLGIKPLDDILRVYHLPQTATSIYTPPQPVLEITSPSSADGKTHLLYHITALAVLPRTYRNIHLAGRGSAIVFLDADGRFDALRLREIAGGIVHERAREQGISLAADRNRGVGRGDDGYDGNEVEENIDVNTMLRTALSHVHVFRPQSSVSLLAALHSLESYLLGENVGHASHCRPLHAILLDSASAFYWQDRREVEILSIPGVREEREREREPLASNDKEGDSAANITTASQLPHKIIAALRALQRTFSCPLVFTTWGLQRAPARSHYSHATTTTATQLYVPNRPSFRPHLPRPWPSFPTCRIVVQRDSVRPFAPLLGLQEVKEREAGWRQQVVARGMVVGWIDWMMSAGGGREEGRMGERVFGFSLKKGGVEWVDGDEGEMLV
ncbi:hypothetical protein AJ79_05881 [Helicocarpus griseus UAMH5409]|uniref:DNA recombination and repair protein Rad51-like C-terminal domain-containing protein n=1 Tax=Helicocarpus griseus UAMH5409 TaxID=1447875 RepID=A0A2B7XJA6_9EURO|nr:hypothetical protein AJ79_05881 [Helicocarpus griseus UAMH5409]